MSSAQGQARRRPPSNARLAGRGGQRGRGKGRGGKAPAAASAAGQEKATKEAAAAALSASKESEEREKARAEKAEAEAVLAPAAESDDSDEEEGEAGEGECLICVERVHLWTLGSCNHRSACWQCGLRRRQLYGANECIICKLANEEVIFTADGARKYEAFELGALVRDEKLRAYFETEAARQEALRLLYEVRCPTCRTEMRSLAALKRHVAEHGLHYCDLCLEGRKVFLHEQKTYASKEALAAHVTYGDKEGDHIRAHPPCDFCRTNFYGVDQLWAHLRDAHTTCSLCEQQGKQHAYFMNMTTLAKHYKQEHYPCLEPDCKGVVFGTAGELKAHDVTVHLPSRNLSKAEERRARTLDIAITYSRPERDEGERGGRGGRSERGGRHGHGEARHDNRAVQLVPAPVAAPAPAAASAPPPPTTVPARSTSPVAPMSKEEVERRNERVVEAIRVYLGDESRLAAFRRISADFRKGSLSPQGYYDAFLKTFGAAKTDEFLPELTALLPDLDRRAALELIHAHDRQRRANPADFPALPSAAAAPPAAAPPMNVAAAAAYRKDRKPSAAFSASDFPALAPGAPPEADDAPPVRGAWAAGGGQQGGGQGGGQQGGGKKKNKKGTVLMKWG